MSIIMQWDVCGIDAGPSTAGAASTNSAAQQHSAWQQTITAGGTVLTSMHSCPICPPLNQGAIVAIEDPARSIFGFQYHPEVAHTEGGMDMIKHFLVDIAGVKPDWTMDQVVEEQMRIIAQTVGELAIRVDSTQVHVTVMSG
jgi:hypothetical protein